MLQGYTLASSAAENLRKLYEVHGEAEFAVHDGSMARIQHAGHAVLSFEIQQSVPKGREPDWLISATDDGASNPQELPFLWVGEGRNSWATGDTPEPPEWAAGLLNRILGSAEPVV